MRSSVTTIEPVGAWNWHTHPEDEPCTTACILVPASYQEVTFFHLCEVPTVGHAGPCAACSAQAAIDAGWARSANVLEDHEARFRRLLADMHQAFDALAEDVRNGPTPPPSLVVAGGWFAPSQQLYDFVDVPESYDLTRVPDFTFARHGLRWSEDDRGVVLSGFLAGFPWHLAGLPRHLAGLPWHRRGRRWRRALWRVLFGVQPC